MIYICVRKTTNWENKDVFFAQLYPAFKPKVDTWNETFDMPFHIFRHQVREIARLNLSRLPKCKCVEWNEVPNGELVVPVDDDDWFAPYLTEVLSRELESETAVYYWITSFLEVPINFRHRLGLLRRALFPRSRPKWMCTSNNYAIVKGAVPENVYASHVEASWWVKKAERIKVKSILKRLSIQNRTLASITSLGFNRPLVRRSELIRKLRAYRKLYTRPVESELEWCRPYVAMMAELMQEIQVRPC